MRSYSDVDISACVTLGDDVAIDYHVCDDGLVEFRVGGRHGFDLSTTKTGLSNLVNCAQQALQEARRKTGSGCE